MDRCPAAAVRAGLTHLTHLVHLADWPERSAIRYAMPRDANSSPSVVAPPVGGVLIQLFCGTVHRKRPPRKRRSLFCFPAASGA